MTGPLSFLRVVALVLVCAIPLLAVGAGMCLRLSRAAGGARWSGVVRTLLLLLAGPCVMVALGTGRDACHASSVQRMVQGALLVPAALVWPAARLASAPGGLDRAAAGLGAEAWTRLRLVWLPLLRGALYLAVLTLCLGAVAIGWSACGGMRPPG